MDYQSAIQRAVVAMAAADGRHDGGVSMHEQPQRYTIAHEVAHLIYICDISHISHTSVGGPSSPPNSNRHPISDIPNPELLETCALPYLKLYIPHALHTRTLTH